jgi:hypothetical protein
MSGGPTLRIAKIVVDEGENADEKSTPASSDSAVNGVATTPVSAVDIPLPPRSGE